MTVPADGTALYRIRGEQALLLYVGVSDDFGRRWKEHAKQQPWWEEMRSLSVDCWYESRDEAGIAEAAAIRAEKPKYNKRHAVPDWREQREIIVGGSGGFKFASRGRLWEQQHERRWVNGHAGFPELHELVAEGRLQVIPAPPVCHRCHHWERSCVCESPELRQAASTGDEAEAIIRRALDDLRNLP